MAACVQEKRVVVVVGQCGTGKSSFIHTWMDPQVAVKPTVSKSAMPVTCRTDEYESQDGGFCLIDTVGLGTKGSDLGLSLEWVQGRLVHFVILLTNLRWEREFKDTVEKLSWAKPQHNISKWAAHRAAFDAGEDYGASAFNALDKNPPALVYLKRLESLTFERVPHKPLAPPPPPAAPTAAFKGLRVASVPVASVPAASKAKQWFGREVEQLIAEQRRMHDSWVRLGVPLPKQVKMQASDWQQLTDFTALQRDRQSGEALLKYHLYIMHGHANFEQNDHIMRKVASIAGLKEHIDGLYQRQHQLANVMGDEKYADYIEALFQHIAEGSKAQKRFVVDFLHMLSS